MEQTQRIERALRHHAACVDEVTATDRHLIDYPGGSDWVRMRDRALALLEESASLLRVLCGCAAWQELGVKRRSAVPDPPAPDPPEHPDRRALEQEALARLRDSGPSTASAPSRPAALAAVEKALEELRTEVCGRPGSVRLGLITQERRLSERVLHLEREKQRWAEQAAELEKDLEKAIEAALAALREEPA